MTILIRVENTDNDRAVMVTTLDDAGKHCIPITVEEATVGPGDTYEVWIHSGRFVKVEEVE